MPTETFMSFPRTLNSMSYMKAQMALSPATADDILNQMTYDIKKKVIDGYRLVARLLTSLLNLVNFTELNTKLNTQNKLTDQTPHPMMM